MKTRETQKNRYLNDITGYNSGADNFDQSRRNKFSQRNYHGLWWDLRRAQEFIKILNKNKIVLKDKEILDLGCHHGFFTNILAGLKKSSRSVQGSDFVPMSIETAKRTNPGIDFTCDDLYNSRLKNNNYDFVLCNYLFNAIPHDDLPKIADTVSSKVKANGYLLFFDFYDSPVISFANRLLYGSKRERKKLPTFNNKKIRKMFPQFRIVESRTIINILRLQLLLECRAPYWLVDFLDNLLPNYYYLALLQKKEK